MYDVIQMSEPKKTIILEGSIFEVDRDKELNKLYTEAVFADGRKTLEPVIETIQKIKDELETQVTNQEKGIKNFDPNKFWRNTLFRDLEDAMIKVFGFRIVSINPYEEKYLSSEKMFESKMLNAWVYSNDRFPIDGLVTDKGFYDKTKSVQMFVYMTLGLIRALDADEILAVIIHEFGHAIDPALVTITYSETNILSKYLTDRKDALTSSEKKVLEKNKKRGFAAEIIGTIIGCLLVIAVLALPAFISWLRDLFMGKEKAEQNRINKIIKMIQSDPDRFTRQEFAEAYADNFARMYGLGPQLMRGLRKISSDYEKYSHNRIKRERARQEYILGLTRDMIKDEHKTDIHRIRSLIKEYNADIADPKTPAPVKKQLQEDLTELEKVLDEYLNNFSEFQNRVNKTINEELMKIEAEENASKKSSEDKKPEEEKKDDQKN